MKRLATILLALTLLAGCGGVREDYQGRDGQARYCEDIGSVYVEATNSCQK